MVTLNVTIELLDEMLGTKAADPEVFATFIASKHPSGTPQRDELDKAEVREETGSSVFHRDQGALGIYDYQIKGYFKDACGSLRNADETKSKELKAYKSKIDGLVFVTPRFITATMPEGLSPGVCERPLRADTMQGPRVTVCRSESLPAGTRFQFTIRLLNGSMASLVLEWLAYGELRGLGQWRNSGKGRFKVILREEKEAGKKAPRETLATA